MYTISAQRTASGYDFLKDGHCLASPKTEWEVDCLLNVHGIHEDICRDFLTRLREKGAATEIMPEVRIRQVDPDSPVSTPH